MPDCLKLNLEGLDLGLGLGQLLGLVAVPTRGAGLDPLVLNRQGLVLPEYRIQLSP